MKKKYITIVVAVIAGLFLLASKFIEPDVPKTSIIKDNSIDNSSIEVHQ